MKTNDIKKALRRKREKEKLTGKDFLSTGSTLLNLAITGYPMRGFAKGRYYFLVGDTSSGKTFLSLTCLAEASINPRFAKYRFIYDNAEGGALMDIKEFFGEEVSNRLLPPNWLKDGPLYSSSIEEFYYHMDDAIKVGHPFIYILDSMDSLTSQAEGDKFDKTKRAHQRGTRAAGSFGDGKAKWNSAHLRRLLTPLRKSGSILIIINQTRDYIGFGHQKKSRSGGHALSFYACLEMWSSVKKQITKIIRGKERQIGTLCQVQVKKNRVKGRDRTVEMPIYHSLGIDDIGSCVDYLIDEGHWKLRDNTIEAEEFDFEGTRKKLIRYIEKEEMEKDLREIVSDVWNEIEGACKVKRKRRYG